jgi:DNA invertase Pin-like site-specific DNA recombinase
VKLVGYVRVSTDRQVEEGLGLAEQERAIRAWAKAGQHRIVGWHRDEGRSGAEGLASRLGLAGALDDVEAGRAQGLVVLRLDRLARDLLVQEQLLAEVWRHGGEVFSTAGGEANLRDDPADPSRKLIRRILGAVAEYERELLLLRLKRGRALKHARGGFAYGSPPFGMRAEGKELVPDRVERRTLIRMRQLRAQGLSLREVAARLDAMGDRPRRASRWSAQTVARALDRTT